MTTARQRFKRRRFLGTLVTAVASCALPGLRARGSENSRRSKIILSFYCDDTSPYAAGAGAFRTFLEFRAEHHIAGEASCILGMNGRSMAREPNEEQQAFLNHVKRAWDCGIDTQMELMTHRGLFDFIESL